MISCKQTPWSAANQTSPKKSRTHCRSPLVSSSTIACRAHLIPAARGADSANHAACPPRAIAAWAASLTFTCLADCHWPTLLPCHERSCYRTRQTHPRLTHCRRSLPASSLRWQVLPAGAIGNRSPSARRPLAVCLTAFLGSRIASAVGLGASRHVDHTWTGPQIG